MAVMRSWMDNYITTSRQDHGGNGHEYLLLKRCRDRSSSIMVAGAAVKIYSVTPLDSVPGATILLT